MLIFVLLSAVYFLARSPWLDDHDAIQFALGVRSFDLWHHQPHPPGYPLFIWLGQLCLTLFGLAPDVSLHLISAIGGAFFVAMWFLIARVQFNERLAWLLTGCLAIAPVVWLTSTKVWTDPLAMGLLSAEILAALWFVRVGEVSPLVLAALCGAAATGTRPQLILICLIVLVIALRQRRACAKLSILAVAVLLGGCILWLVPLSYSQWRLRSDVSPWLVYPKLLYGQWIWRLDKPNAYIGAGDWSPIYLATRIGAHFGGWFGMGFGLVSSPVVFVVGAFVLAVGLCLYLFRPREPKDRQFWRFHWPWATVHAVTVFAFLPADQRYYLIIYPLLLTAILHGYLQATPFFRRLVWVVPIFLLVALVPIAVTNHTRPAPKIRLIRYLATLYPPGERANVALFLIQSKRHADWYAPGFNTFSQVPPAAQLSEILSNAAAAYTDDNNVVPPKGWKLVELANYPQWLVIDRQRGPLHLYRIERERGGS